MSNELVRYDAMCRAIAEAHQVDEAKHIRDKLVAIQVYARQAKNVEAERQACEIRLRAERKCGELLREMEKAKGGQPYQSHNSTSRPEIQSLSDLGISKDQSSLWQKLAAVPADRFEEALHDDRPTAFGIIGANAKPETDVTSEALWIWGRLRDFERDGLLDQDPNDLIENMRPHMRETTRTLAPRVAAWLRRICDDR